MKLEEIGFYTLCDSRAFNASVTSPLWRCELLLTDACNFRCPYCRGLRKDMAGSISFDQAKYTLDLWIKLHDPYQDPICRTNCLDVCIDYNAKADLTHKF